MVCKISKLRVLVFIILLVFHNNIVLASQEKELSFEMIYCGLGLFHSGQAYKFSDGTTLFVESTYYKSKKLTMEALKKELQKSTKILEKTETIDPTSLLTKETFTIEVLDKDIAQIVVSIIKVQENQIYKITASSLRHINFFRESQKSNQTTISNK